MTLLSTLATIFGALMSFASIPQAYKIFKRKSAKDVSALTFFLFFIGSIIWIFYGIEIKNIPIIFSYSFGTLTSLSVLVARYIYR